MRRPPGSTLAPSTVSSTRHSIRGPSPVRPGMPGPNAAPCTGDAAWPSTPGSTEDRRVNRQRSAFGFVDEEGDSTELRSRREAGEGAAQLLDRAASGSDDRQHRRGARAVALTVFAGAHGAQMDEEAALLSEDAPLHILRTVSLNARDRALILVDFVQLYALFWVASRLWPFPFHWTRWTRYSLAANADITPWVHFDSIYSGAEPGAAARETSPWGEWDGYLAAAAVAGAVAFALPACYAAYMAWLRRQEDDYLRHRAACARALLLTAQLVYAPVAVNTARLVNCREDGALEVDPSHACGGAYHLGVACTAGVAAAALLVGTPALLASLAARHRVYRGAATHERYLRWKEIEYMLGVSDDWRVQHLNEISPFTAAGAYARPVALAEKLALVALNTLVRDDAALQSVAYFAVFACFMLWAAVAPPYRNRATNALLLLSRTFLAYVGVFGMLKATGSRSALMIDSALVIWLLVGTAALGAAGLVWAALEARRWRRGDPAWPVTKATAIANAHRGWMRALRESGDLLYDCRFTAQELLPTHRLHEQLMHLRQCLASATATGSVLEWSLVAAMNEIAPMYQRAKAYSYLPNPRLEAVLPALARRMRQRQYERILLSPRKHRILTKLLALRTFLLSTSAGGGVEGGGKGDAGEAPMARPSSSSSPRPAQGSTGGDAAFGTRPRLAADVVSAHGLDRMKLLEALEEEEEPGAGGDSLLGFSVDEIAQALMGDTERALVRPRELEELQRVRQLWKRMIQRWEAQFERDHDGAAPKVADKGPILPWYKHHKSVALALREEFGTWA